MNPIKKAATVVALFLSFSFIAKAQENSKEAAAIPKEEKSVTHHSIVIDGKTINYTATAGALIVRNNIDEPGAFYGDTY